MENEFYGGPDRTQFGKHEGCTMTEDNSMDEQDRIEQSRTNETGKIASEWKSEVGSRVMSPPQLLKKAGEADDYDEKLRLYDEALKLDPVCTDALLQKGFSLDRIGKSEEALDCYNRALEIDPDNMGIWCLKGFAFNNLKNFEKAVECYDEVLKINPKDVFAWCQKGISFEAMGKLEDAVECYDKVLEIDPTDALIREKKLKLLSILYSEGGTGDSPDKYFN
jgi:tetratricopeptide (TPR) repeat protein